MTTIAPGLHLSGRLSDEHYIDYIRHDIRRIRRLILLTYRMFEHESDELLYFGAIEDLLKNLQDRIDRQIEKGGFA